VLVSFFWSVFGLFGAISSVIACAYMVWAQSGLVVVLLACLDFVVLDCSLDALLSGFAVFPVLCIGSCCFFFFLILTFCVSIVLFYLRYFFCVGYFAFKSFI